jgi:PTH1 family peptidyl-tRNA hydrolase
MSPREPVLLAGLGNPGPAYAATRHNLGFRLVDRVGAALGASVVDRRYSALFGRARLAGRTLYLLKPQTYMNRSGLAVREALQGLGLGPEHLWVAHDDVDLPLGRLRLRLRGSSGGHRGVASVIEAVGTEGFGRIRMGIGRPPAGVETADYVLRPFTPEEEPEVDRMLERAAEAVETLLREGAEAAMSRHNG